MIVPCLGTVLSLEAMRQRLPRYCRCRSLSLLYCHILCDPFDFPGLFSFILLCFLRHHVCQSHNAPVQYSNERVLEFIRLGFDFHLVVYALSSKWLKMGKRVLGETTNVHFLSYVPLALHTKKANIRNCGVRCAAG